jgi:hypothetical protein
VAEHSENGNCERLITNGDTSFTWGYQ